MRSGEELKTKARFGILIKRGVPRGFIDFCCILEKSFDTRTLLGQYIFLSNFILTLVHVPMMILWHVSWAF